MKNIVIVSTVSPNDEQRGAVIRLENLIANHSNNLRLILVLTLRRRPDERYRGTKIIHLAPSLMDWPKIFRLAVTGPVTNAIFLRASLDKYVRSDDQVVFSPNQGHFKGLWHRLLRLIYVNLLRKISNFVPDFMDY